ncbi:MAG TPA: Spy/CpxP family protein refolding chaperone [Burkholderiales bacterium]|nr:Spy/CpxP family protein refolding chaperone [Burkholderiales bacterium]
MRTALILAGALAFASPLAGAQGPGMMGDGMRGQGMMGQGMMGQGMMDQGMMGQGMMGQGMGAQQGGMLAALNLSDAQREKVLAIQEEHRKKNWAAMGEVRAEQYKLRSLYGADKLDADKVAEQQKKVDELRRQMLKSRIEAHNQIAALLTPEQRKELRQRAPGWMMEGSE